MSRGLNRHRASASRCTERGRSFWQVVRDEWLKVCAGASIGLAGAMLVFVCTPFLEIVKARFEFLRFFDRPTNANFTYPNWKVTVGDYEGHLDLVERPATEVFGRFSLHEKGQISSAYFGHVSARRDSKHFIGDLIWDSVNVRWDVTAEWNGESNQSIQILGQAVRKEMRPGKGWESTVTERFFAIAPKH